jgi:hypothetical protein
MKPEQKARAQLSQTAAYFFSKAPDPRSTITDS